MRWVLGRVVLQEDKRGQAPFPTSILMMHVVMTSKLVHEGRRARALSKALRGQASFPTSILMIHVVMTKILVPEAGRCGAALRGRVTATVMSERDQMKTRGGSWSG